MTKTVNMALWQLIATILSAGAVPAAGTFYTLGSVQAAQAVRIERNERDLDDVRKEMRILVSDTRKIVDEMRDVTIELSQEVVRLGAIKK